MKKTTKKPAAKSKPKSVPAKKGAPVAEAEEESKPFNPDEFRVEEATPRAEPKWVELQCPYCDENFEVKVIPSEEGITLTQECQVCCKTLTITVDFDDGEPSAYASR
ncbi:MAG: CPXCG motif-containing cysteine-rich protein [Elusimicrobiota bacterium]|jgi:hypothetical protein